MPADPVRTLGIPPCGSIAWRKIARLQAELIEEELRAAPVPEQERKAA